MADIPGSPGNDILFGTPEDDRIAGRAGSDWLAGLAGNDILKGDGDGDLLTGGKGFDLLVGGNGNDFLLGGPGDDALRGGPGADLPSGGPGDDILLVGGGGDHLLGGAGNDTFLVLPNGELDLFPETEVIIDSGPEQHRFAAELAETLPQLVLGLMFRADLADDQAMLFDLGSLGGEQPVAFTMRNTFVPLDILFIDADGRVVSVAEQTVPLSEEPIPSGEPVRAVLEVPAGTAAALGISGGDRVLHPIFGTGNLAAAGGADDEAPHEALRHGNDTILDFTQGEDAIDIPFFGGLTFADFDTNGNGVLDDDDALVAVAGGDTVIDFSAFTPDPADAYALTIAGVTGLTAADLLLPGAAGGPRPTGLDETTPLAGGGTGTRQAEPAAGVATDDEPDARGGALEITDVLSDPEAGEVDPTGYLAEHTDPAIKAGSGVQQGEAGSLAAVEGAGGTGLDDLVGDGSVAADGA